MSPVGELEKKTQERVIGLFQGHLGYRTLGNWRDREDNRNIEPAILTQSLEGRGYSSGIANKALHELERAARLGGSHTLYDINSEVYSLLRYGAKVSPAVGQNRITVHYVDWKNPSANDFAIAEEVTVIGQNNKRPDLIIYVNGIALGVIELKRSTVSVAEGIRQNLANQQKHFIWHFFSTVQLVLAGNDTQGLRYGVIETPEKYWLRWREAKRVQSDATPENMPMIPPNTKFASPLLQELAQLCAPSRFLEVIHDFLTFDAGNKKVCRPNQYFGVKAAQPYVNRRAGGIIWHTQGSGKSLTMVWLARWIRENVPGSRILVITDRTELDEQIEQVFHGVGEDIHRTQSGADLAYALHDPAKSLVCSLVHKFGGSEEGDFSHYVEDLGANMSGKDRSSKDIFVFVDECHRTQSGKLHNAMKRLLPDSTLIGFTGTPLLKADRRRSIESFGPYIHTYKYDEAIRENVVLDLRYEARDIDQQLTSRDKIDQWFDIKTQGLSDLARAQLRKRWGTIKKVSSAKDRIYKIVGDILMDMETRDRLKSGRGNALLVSNSIYAACRFFEHFNETQLRGKCAIVSSYHPHPADIAGEESGEGATEKLLKHRVYRRMLADHFSEPEDSAMYKVEQFEKEVKKRFVEKPAQMKLLIVVDKLLTGFDAPPATYLYIDKKMQDHGLFQAICRVNRLDGEDKEYGNIIDYKDLFHSLADAVIDYTGSAFDGYSQEDVQGLLTNRLERGKERLEEAREAVRALCEPVELPRDTPDYLRYFCHDGTGDGASIIRQLAANERKRLTLYRLVAAYLRSYADLANEMIDAGYTEDDRMATRDEVDHYENVRQEVKMNSGDYVDLKVYEPAMRHLLDAYIRADESRVLSTFDDMTLVDLLIDRAEDAIESLPDGIRKNRHTIAETIENNVRRLIVDKMALNPKYYERMSKLLDELIRRRREEVDEYEEYLKKVVALAKKVKSREGESSHPQNINNPALRAIYDNLAEIANSNDRESVALAVDRAVNEAKMADWRGHQIKERQIKRAIYNALGPWKDRTEEIFAIVKAQDEY